MYQTILLLFLLFFSLSFLSSFLVVSFFPVVSFSNVILPRLHSPRRPLPPPHTHAPTSAHSNKTHSKHDKDIRDNIDSAIR